TVLGIDPAALPGLDGWRRDFADESPTRLAALLRGGAPPAGPVVPADGRRLLLTAAFLLPDGRGAVVDLGRLGARPLEAALPPELRGARLVRIGVRPATRVLERGADSGRALVGSFRLRGASVD